MKEIELQGKQLLALEYATDPKRRLVPITGQAGTGKTSIIKAIYDQLKSVSITVAVVAPTGRAARRITEATGVSAVTIHKLLGYGKPQIDPDTGLPIENTKPSFGKVRTPNGVVYTPLPYQVVLVDEYAMVNEELHKNIDDALGNGCRLIVSGDVDQLPPIEKYEITDEHGKLLPSPFERLLRLPSAVHLDTVYRQDANSGILHNARLIRMGKSPVSRDDFSIVNTDITLQALRNLMSSERYDFSTLDHQVIVPARVGQLGTHKVNQIMQAHYNPFGENRTQLPRYIPKNAKTRPDPVYVSIGDKVLCEENTYDMRDFFQRYTEWRGNEPNYSTFIPCPDTFSMLNGEIGILEAIAEDGTLHINFGDRTVTVPHSFREYNKHLKQIVNVDPRRRIDLAYAITTHKAQGSEFDTVVYMLHRVSSWMQDRNNFYTAVTRAKKNVILITDNPSYNQAAKLSNREKQALRRKK